MTGADHYRKAEALLRFADRLQDDDETQPVLLARAQVHATLSLAAASAQNIRRNGAIDVGECGDWTEVIG